MKQIKDVRTISDEEFLEYIKQPLQKLEKVRQANIRECMIRSFWTVRYGPIVLLIALCIDCWLFTIAGIAGITPFVAVMIFIWVTTPEKLYLLAYKKKIIPQLVSICFDMNSVNDQNMNLHNMIRRSAIFPSFNKTEIEFYSRGKHKDISIELYKIALKIPKDPPFFYKLIIPTRYYSIYRGLMIFMDIKSKRFYGFTKVTPDFPDIVGGMNNSNLEQANLVDLEFEDMFDIHTNDQVEARYLIDPLMMESFKSLQENTNGEGLTASFYDNKLLISLPENHNFFTPKNMDVSATDPEFILRLKHKIESILNIADKLVLYDPEEVHKNAEAS